MRPAPVGLSPASRTPPAGAEPAVVPGSRGRPAGTATAWVRSLLDRSRLAVAIPDLVFVQSGPELLEAAPASELVLVDLAAPGALALLPLLVSACRGDVVAFGPHVDRALLAEASALGAQAVPRSRLFSRPLETLGLVGGPGQH